MLELHQYYVPLLRDFYCMFLIDKLMFCLTLLDFNSIKSNSILTAFISYLSLMNKYNKTHKGILTNLSQLYFY